MGDRPRTTRDPARWIVPLAIVVTVAFIHGETLENGFHWDDLFGIVDNPWIRDLSNVPRFFTDGRTLTPVRINSDYRPVLQITYALNHAWSGYDPWSWHVVNIVLHAIVSVGVWSVGRRLLGTGRLRPIRWLAEGEGDRAAAGAALLFAVHPIAVCPVQYMWARSSLLVAAFVVPAMALHLGAMAAGRSRTPSVALLYGLALFAKAEAISLLGVLVLAEILFRPVAGGVPRGRPALARFAPILALTVIYLMIRRQVLPPGVQEDRDTPDLTTGDYLLTQLRVWWLYAGRILAPLDLPVDDSSYPVSRSIADPGVLLAMFGWAWMALALLRGARSTPAVTLLGLSWFVHLSPHSSLVPIPQMHNAYRPYLASTGVFLLLATGVVVLARSFRPGPGPVLAVLAAVTILDLGILTRAHNRAWKDELSLWASVLARHPRAARAHLNYGVALQELGRLPEAQARFREALRLDPRSPLGHVNLARVLEARGALDAARRSHDAAVEADPSHAASYYWRGLFRARRNDPAGAESDFGRALELDDRSIRPRERLARILAATGRPAEAVALLRQGLPLDPPRFRALLEEIRAGGPPGPAPLQGDP